MSVCFWRGGPGTGEKLEDKGKDVPLLVLRNWKKKIVKSWKEVFKKDKNLNFIKPLTKHAILRFFCTGFLRGSSYIR